MMTERELWDALLEWAIDIYKEPLSWETRADYEKYGDIIDVEVKVDTQKYPMGLIKKDK